MIKYGLLFWRRFRTDETDGIDGTIEAGGIDGIDGTDESGGVIEAGGVIETDGIDGTDVTDKTCEYIQILGGLFVY